MTSTYQDSTILYLVSDDFHINNPEVAEAYWQLAIPLIKAFDIVEGINNIIQSTFPATTHVMDADGAAWNDCYAAWCAFFACPTAPFKIRSPEYMALEGLFASQASAVDHYLPRLGMELENVFDGWVHCSSSAPTVLITLS